MPYKVHQFLTQIDILHNWLNSVLQCTESFAILQRVQNCGPISVASFLYFDVTKKAFLAFEMSVKCVAHDLERDM